MKIPKTLKEQMEHKFSIKQNELEPFFHEEVEKKNKFMTVKVKLPQEKNFTVMELNKMEFQKELEKVEQDIQDSEHKKKREYIR